MSNTALKACPAPGSPVQAVVIPVYAVTATIHNQGYGVAAIHGHRHRSAEAALRGGHGQDVTITAMLTGDDPAGRLHDLVGGEWSLIDQKTTGTRKARNVGWRVASRTVACTDPEPCDEARWEDARRVGAAFAWELEKHQLAAQLSDVLATMGVTDVPWDTTGGPNRYLRLAARSRGNNRDRAHAAPEPLATLITYEYTAYDADRITVLVPCPIPSTQAYLRNEDMTFGQWLDVAAEDLMRTGLRGYDVTGPAHD